MANDVFANGREISCKAADGKSICAFPDVCFTPPQSPATPPGVPVPYPNTGLAKDTTSGSRSVRISGKEVMLKNKSYFKKSLGDEAGCAPKKGILTSVNRGKVYFTSWSMDVKYEGENVVRHLDLTTHNHASTNPNTLPTVHQDTVAFGNSKECTKDSKKAKKACENAQSTGKGKKMRLDCSKAPSCAKAMECILVAKGRDKRQCCKPDNTGHHLIEDHWVRPGGTPLSGFAHIDNLYHGAPTLCVNQSRFRDKHGLAHGTGGVLEECFKNKPFSYADGKKIALEAHRDACPNAGCSDGCIAAQLDAFYNQPAKGEKTPAKRKLHTPDRKQPLNAEQRKAAEKRLKKRKLI